MFRQTRIVVCPYVDASQSGVVLTAYAFGKPVVATNIGGLPEYVAPGETGLLVPPSDPNALAEAIVTLLSDSALRDSMASKIDLAVVGDRGWADIAKMTEDVYRTTLRQFG